MVSKPSIKIIEENVQNYSYYLDLPVSYEDDNKKYNEKMFSIFEEYNTDVWVAAIAHGTNAPFHGDVAGGIYKNGVVSHEFFLYFSGLNQFSNN